jgi:diguanylate cyclase (GGDEF)-like protein
VSPFRLPAGLAAALAAGRPPTGAKRIVVALVVASGVAVHIPDATPAAVGLAVLTTVLASLWLGTLPRTVVLAGLALVALPYPVSRLAGGLTAVGALLLVLAGFTVSFLTTQMLAAQETALRTLGARDDLARRNQLEYEDLHSRLEQVSTRDPLTSLLHRKALLHHLDALLALPGTTGVLVLSLSRFTQINEAYGADVGDELLAAVAERLRRSAREGDQVGRLGGDEFGVVLHGLTAETAQPVTDRLVQLLDDPFTVGPYVLSVTASSGLALHAGDGSCTAAELLQRALTAAHSGAPGFVTHVYDAAAEARAADALVLQDDLSAGLERGEFFLLYQPKVCTRTGRMTSVEALVRWQHPTRGLVAPDAFIGIAERSGLIAPLGLHVLQMACAQLREWASLAPGLSVAVNVSARQLVEPDFVDQVRGVLFGSGIDPARIILELTESLMVEDEEAAVAVLWQLRGLGVRMSLDDFGTGYSSLARLGSLPLDEMKIDKSFVDRLGAKPQDSTALVTAAVAMGHGLGLKVVAEGVEDAMQAAMLTGVGCDLLQGYLLGKPQRPADLATQFARPLLVPQPALPSPRALADTAATHVPRVLPG